MDTKKQEKIMITIIIIGTLIYGFIKLIDHGKKELGLTKVSSYKNYNEMLEIKTDSNIDIAFMLDKDNRVIKSLYFTNKSLFLEIEKYEDRKIEKKIDNVLEDIITTKNIKDNLYIIEYSNYKLQDKIEKQINDLLLEKNIKVNIIKKKRSLSAKAKEIKVNIKEKNRILILLSMYSKDIINREDSNLQKDIVKLNKDDALEYSNIIYNKLLKYQKSNNIITELKDQTKIKIETIPIKSDINLYPDNSSWYYIENSKVYAYIKFTVGNDSYSFCYRGINDVKEGEC